MNRYHARISLNPQSQINLAGEGNRRKRFNHRFLRLKVYAIQSLVVDYLVVGNPAVAVRWQMEKKRHANYAQIIAIRVLLCSKSCLKHFKVKVLEVE